MKIHYYTEKEIEFLKRIKGTDSYRNIALRFNTKFNTNITKEAIRRKINRGLSVSHVPKYTEEQDNFIKENLSIFSYKKVSELFYEKYGIEITEQAIADRRRRVYCIDVNKYSDKKDFSMNWCNFPIGTEIERDGSIMVKVSNELRNGDNNWKYKHHYIWEKHNGPVPEKHRILFLDGNKKNFNIDNLVCVPLKYICVMAANKWQFKNFEITKTAIKWCELFYSLKEGK